MERLKPFESLRGRAPAAALLALALVAATACGPQVIKGRPPFITIAAMSLVDDTLTAEFDIANQNGVPMVIDSIDITVTVGDAQLTRYNDAFSLEIGANSTEDVLVEEMPDDFTRTLLTSLRNGTLDSLNFDLAGRVHTAENDYLRFEHTGYLYPVPGKPGHFRSAVTQSKGLRRDDDL
jgi:hypothetical protein